MKATLESTTRIQTITLPDKRKISCRAWVGKTENGIPFTAYVAMVMVAADADNSAFERELQEVT